MEARTGPGRYGNFRQRRGKAGLSLGLLQWALCHFLVCGLARRVDGLLGAEVSPLDDSSLSGLSIQFIP